MGSWGEGSGKRPLPAAQTKGRAGGHPELKGPPHPGDSHSLGEPPPPRPHNRAANSAVDTKARDPPHPQPAPSFPAALCLLGSVSAADSAPRTAPAARGRALLAAEGGSAGTRSGSAAPTPSSLPGVVVVVFVLCFFPFFPKENISKSLRTSAAPFSPSPPRRAGGRPTPSPRSSPPSWCPGGQKGGGWGSGRIRSGEGPGSVSAEGVRRGRLGLGGIQQSFASPAPRCAAPSVPGGPVPP